MQRTSITATVLTCLLFSSWSHVASAEEPPAAPSDDVVDDDMAPEEEKPAIPPDSPPADAPGTPPADAPGTPPAGAPKGPDEPQPAAPPPPSKAQEPSEEMAADEADLMDEETPSRPPAKGKGAVWGTVKDAVEKEPLPEATVTVVGTKYKTVADYEGHYRLELPPGTYTLRFFFELHRPALVKDVVVKAGRVEQVDSDVLPDEAAVETFEVVTQADTASVEGQVLARQRSAAVGDGVGRSEIAKTPASNAAQAAQRVVGATVVGGRFIYVRGLGERYTNALLNDAPLPSPEPDRAAIPLDLFPSLILDNLTIVKTFTPDVPADFAGGSVRIQTRELPSKPLFQASAGLGFDDGATFRERMAQRGSSTDFLGFDSGMRALPSRLKNGFPVDPEEQIQAGKEINSFMTPVRSFTPPNYSLSAVAGSGWALPHDQRIGALVTANYGRSYTIREDMILRNFRLAVAPNGVDIIAKPANDYRGDFGNDRVNWGALASVSYWPAQHHRLTILGVHTQIADSSVQVVRGLNESRSANVVNTRLNYVSRALNFGQLRGEHDFSSLSNARLEWNASLSGASRDQPDTRDTVFQSSQGEDYTSIGTPENGRHFFAGQNETTRGGGLDWTQPLSKTPDATRVKLGGLVSLKSRDFSARSYHLGSTFTGPPFSCGPVYTRECPDALYVNNNIGTELALAEDTQDVDAYKAFLNVFATYAMLDLALLKDLRVVGGARVEVTRQEIDPYSQVMGGNDFPPKSIDSTDVLPAVSVVYSATKRTKFRLSVARTLARPQIRELSPQVWADYFGARAFGGNPDLQLTHINNGDLRFEYYPTQSEVLAFSFFFKDFEKPIENIVLDSGADGTVQPRNARGARMLGVELEARKSLASLSPTLKLFSVIGNLTLARSKIEIDTSDPLVKVTNLSRPMVNQSPFVVNLALDYNNEDSGTGVRLLYNVAGKRIVEVGTRDMPDSYEHPKHLLDLSVSQSAGKHLQFRLSATNLLGSKYVVTVGPENRDDQIQQSYSEPRVFTLSGAYTL